MYIFVLFRSGSDPIFGSFTIIFVLSPLVVYIVLNRKEWKSWFRDDQHTSNRGYGLLGQVPILKIGKYWQYLEDLADIQSAKKELSLLKSEVKKNIEANPSIFNESKNWDLEGILSSLKLSEGSSNLLTEIWTSSFGKVSPHRVKSFHMVCENL